MRRFFSKQFSPRPNAAAAAHDKAVEGYDEPTLCAVAADLGQRRPSAGDAEGRWIMGRLAAVRARLRSVKNLILNWLI